MLESCFLICLMCRSAAALRQNITECSLRFHEKQIEKFVNAHFNGFSFISLFFSSHSLGDASASMDYTTAKKKNNALIESENNDA